MRKVKTSSILFFLVPGFLVYCYMFIIPTIEAFYISLLDWNGFRAERIFVGLRNFVRLTRDDVFFIALGNTFLLMFIGALVAFAVVLLLTFLLTRGGGLRGRSFFTNLFYFPNMISMAAYGVMWIFIFNPTFGLINNITGLFGIEPIAWLGVRSTAIASIIFASTIPAVGFYLILMMAGVDKIPNTFREAAVVDGASDLTIFFKITLPLMRDIIVIMCSLWIINGMRNFDFIWALTNGGPANATQTLGTYLYGFATGMTAGVGGATLGSIELGYATAIAMVVFACSVILVGLLRKGFDRESLQY